MVSNHSRSVPDFEAIARRIVDRVESHIREPFIPGEDDPVRNTVIRQIAEDLREIWSEKTGTVSSFVQGNREQV